MKPSVYIETSIVSYYTARPSRDLIIAGRQQMTRDWWENERHRYSLYVSALVLRESRQGEPSAARKREQVLRSIAVLETSEATEHLAAMLVKEGSIPSGYPEDALHIAVAATGEMDYLLTWNFRHINNAQTRSAIAGVVESFGLVCPVICTPEELKGE